MQRFEQRGSVYVLTRRKLAQIAKKSKNGKLSDHIRRKRRKRRGTDVSRRGRRKYPILSTWTPFWCPMQLDYQQPHRWHGCLRYFVHWVRKIPSRGHFEHQLQRFWVILALIKDQKELKMCKNREKIHFFAFFLFLSKVIGHLFCNFALDFGQTCPECEKNEY